MLPELLDLEGESEVADWKKEFDKALAAGRLLATGITKADGAVKLHINNKRGKITRDDRKAKTELEKAQLQDTRTRSKAIAKKIAAPKEAAVLPLTQVSFLSFTPVTRFTGEAKPEATSDPIIFTNTVFLDTWLGSDTVQSDMASFGGVYKKELDDGRMQKQITKEKLANVTKVLFEHVKPEGHEDVSSISVGKSFERSMFFFGWEVAMHHCAFLPQCATMLRMMFAGAVDVYMIHVEDLEKADLCEFNNGEAKAPLSEIRTKFAEMKSDDVEKALEKGAKIFYTRLQAGALLLIPQGMLVLESAHQGPLLFGIRKSFFEASPVAVTRMEKCLAIMQQGGKSQEKQEAIFQYLKVQSGKKEKAKDSTAA